jgi:hypothetical protein
VDAETIGMLALTAVDVVLVGAAIFFGWRPFKGVFGAIKRHALRFSLAFFGVLLSLYVAIPLTDALLYDHGHVMPADFMIFFAPAFMLTMSSATGLFVVWKAARE